MPFISTSSGIVMRRSTSSAAWPGHCVTICTMGGDSSGYESIGRFRKENTPHTATQLMATMTMRRCDKANETIRSIIWFCSRPDRSPRLLLIRVRKLQEHAPLRDHALARLQSFNNLCLVVVLAAELHETLPELSLFHLHVHERQVLVIEKNRSGRDDEHVLRCLVVDHHVDEEILLEKAGVVLRDDADWRGACCRIDHIADVCDRAVEGLRKRGVAFIDLVTVVD